MAGDYEKISPTALGVAYARSFSDIPYSKEINEICQSGITADQKPEIYWKFLAPFFEARFKALSCLLKQSGIANVIEIAAGISPRGLLFTTQDKSITYIETDLSDMLKQKQKILGQLLKQEKVSVPQNLHSAVLNVFDRKEFQDIIETFPSGPIAIIHEGLLAYFTRDEKKALAEIIHHVIAKRDGVWITPDIFTRAEFAKTVPDSATQKAVDDLESQTGRHYDANAFADTDDEKNFFTDLGFDFTIRTFAETAGDISSLKTALDPVYARNQIDQRIWELRVRK